MANGYLKKQSKGKGTVGSDMLEKIHRNHADLSLVWLLTGKGPMLEETAVPQELQMQEEDSGNFIISKDDIIILLREQVSMLDRSLADKEKIILMLETKLRRIKKTRP